MMRGWGQMMRGWGQMMRRGDIRATHVLITPSVVLIMI